MRRTSHRPVRLVGALLVVGLPWLTAACGGGGGGSVSSEQLARGYDEYRKTCATCHGPEGRGMPRLGKDLHGNEFVKNLSDDELVEFLKVGRPAGHPLNERGVDMPPRGGNPALSDEGLRLIVAYLRSIA